MATNQRRAAGRRRAWGRGPILLRFEPLEDRQLLSTTTSITPTTTTDVTAIASTTSDVSATTAPAVTPTPTTTTSAAFLPDLHAAAFDTLRSLSWGDTFHARGKIANLGNAPVTTPFQVAIYASATPDTGTSAVLLGEVTVPAGLQPGQTAIYDQTLSLPSKPITGFDATKSLYIVGKIDPAKTIQEGTSPSLQAAGQGLDVSSVTIVPHQPSDLVSTFLSASPSQPQWGQPLQLNATVQNAGSGNAPASRALVVLTPLGIAPGGASDVAIGTIAVPSVEAFGMVTVNQAIVLPTSPPAALAGSTQFTLSLIQDADYVANHIYPHAAVQGSGKDSTQISIPTAADLSVANAPKADVAVTVSLKTPNTPLTFGGPSFQVNTTVHNQGQADVGMFRVRFLLVGPDGALNNSLFLGDTQLSGLKAGYAQNIIQTLQLPSQLPGGMVLNTGSKGRIAVIVDPEHTQNLSSRTDTSAVSGLVTLKVVGADGQVVTASTPGTATTQTNTASQNTKPLTLAQKRKAAAAAAKTQHSFSHNLNVFPKRAYNFVKNGFKNK